MILYRSHSEFEYDTILAFSKSLCIIMWAVYFSGLE